MASVLGLWNDRKALAIPFRTLEEVESIEVRFDGRPIVAFWASGTRSVLDAAQIDASRDIGSTGAFETTLGGQRLSFRANGDGRFVDQETGSLWSVSGEAIDGPLEGKHLTPVVHGDHFWFT